MTYLLKQTNIFSENLHKISQPGYEKYSGHLFSVAQTSVTSLSWVRSWSLITYEVTSPLCRLSAPVGAPVCPTKQEAMVPPRYVILTFEYVFYQRN